MKEINWYIIEQIKEYFYIYLYKQKIHRKSLKIPEDTCDEGTPVMRGHLWRGDILQVTSHYRVLLYTDIWHSTSDIMTVLSAPYEKNCHKTEHIKMLL